MAIASYHVSEFVCFLSYTKSLLGEVFRGSVDWRSIGRENNFDILPPGKNLKERLTEQW